MTLIMSQDKCAQSLVILLCVHLRFEHMCCFQTAFQGSEVIFSPVLVVYDNSTGVLSFPLQ